MNIRVEFEAEVKNSIVELRVGFEAAVRNSFVELKVSLDSITAELKDAVDCLQRMKLDEDEDLLKPSSDSTHRVGADSKLILVESKSVSDFTLHSSIPVYSNREGEETYRSTTETQVSHRDEACLEVEVQKYNGNSSFLAYREGKPFISTLDFLHVFVESQGRGVRVPQQANYKTLRQFDIWKFPYEDSWNIITHVTQFQFTSKCDISSTTKYTQLIFDRGKEFEGSKLLDKYTGDFVIKHKFVLGYHLYLSIEYLKVFEFVKIREKCIPSKLFEEMTQQEGALCCIFGLYVTKEGESSNPVGVYCIRKVDGRVFDRGRLIYLIKRYSCYIRSSSKINLELLFVELDEFLLDKAGESPHVCKLCDKLLQHIITLWNVLKLLVLQVTRINGYENAPGRIAQLQVEDCRPQILISVAWKVFREIVTSTTSCHMLLLWDLETFMDYSILVFFFLFEFNLFFFGLRSIRRSISYVWMFVELLVSHGSIICGSNCWSASWEENHLLQLMNDASVKIETESNQTVCSCGCEVLKLCSKNVQRYLLVLLAPKKFKLRMVLHSELIELRTCEFDWHSNPCCCLLWSGMDFVRRIFDRGRSLESIRRSIEFCLDTLAPCIFVHNGSKLVVGYNGNVFLIVTNDGGI